MAAPRKKTSTGFAVSLEPKEETPSTSTDDEQSVTFLIEPQPEQLVEVPEVEPTVPEIQQVVVPVVEPPKVVTSPPVENRKHLRHPRNIPKFSSTR